MPDPGPLRRDPAPGVFLRPLAEPRSESGSVPVPEAAVRARAADGPRTLGRGGA